MYLFLVFPTGLRGRERARARLDSIREQVLAVPPGSDWLLGVLRREFKDGSRPGVGFVFDGNRICGNQKLGVAG